LGIEAGERVAAVDAGVGAFREVFPAAVLEEGEQAPRLDVFGHVIAVLLRGEFADFLAVAVHDANLAVVENDFLSAGDRFCPTPLDKVGGEIRLEQASVNENSACKSRCQQA